ncbi:MAG: SDR family oxidoreductase [Gemmatimonadaceae bacterium]|nr:SDR family oxidoreductase [Chitinophagaceae bacterium]
MKESTQIALVTGGSRGLGKDMALSLARKGQDVIITFNNNSADADAVVAQIIALGQKAAALKLDVGDVSSFGHFRNTLSSLLTSSFGRDRFDYLVNNAGIGITAGITETSEEQFDLLMNIHFKGVYFLTQKLLPVINDGGGIVNISTGLTRFVFAGYGIYASMKSAVEALTRYEAKELGARGIRVNTVAPGAIETDFGGGLVRDNAGVNEHIASITALGRVGTADDIGGVVAFLCSRDAKWVNGQRLEVSGGVNL